MIHSQGTTPAHRAAVVSTLLRTVGLSSLAFCWLTLQPGTGQAQQSGPPVANGEALRVFFDCSGRSCDSRYYRTEIDWVNWVRDRTLAQVHLLMTSQRTGSGGNEFGLDFVGLEGLAGQDDRLTYTSLGTDTQQEVLRGISQVLAVGLARYSVLAGAGEGLQVQRTDEARDLTDRLVTGDQVEDPWNFWVFNVGMNGNYSAETSESSGRISGNFSASRTTTTWKFSFRGNGSFRRDEFELTDSSTFVDKRTDWNMNQQLVYSLADHWSVGLGSRASSSTRSNQDIGIEIQPGIEYSVWPYEEAPRRSLTMVYRAGVEYFNWEEETIYGETSETRPGQRFEVSLFQRQEWGDSRVSLEASSFLDDFSQNRVELDGRVSVRLFRGLRCNVGGGAERIRDQIFLAAEGLTDEEILLRRLERPSSFDIQIRAGFSYQFGSIFNNVVNNRF